MPKKRKTETQAEQSKRFLDAVQELIDAGELNPIEADKQFDNALEKMAPKISPKQSSNST